MPEWIKIAAQGDLPPAGEVREFACGEKMICVANLNGEYCAVDNVCLHRGGPLGQGSMLGGKIVCPWHGWMFDAKTGAVDHNSAMKTRAYPLRIDDDDVKIEV